MEVQSKSFSKTLRRPLAQSRRNARVCGCSSMAEQKLPKLLTSAEICPPASKSQQLTGVSIQKLRNRAQNRNGPEARLHPHPGPDHETWCGGSMADSFPKQILPFLEGRIGALRIMRFWSKVDMRGPGECWNWQASLNRNGYGRFKLASYDMITASRMALICTKREEPAGMLVLHTCDNAACCNPAHLYFGTTQQNTADKVARGRCYNGDQAGTKNGAAKLDERQLELVVKRLQDGWNNQQIAADLPITHSMVSKIRLGHMWRDQTAALGWVPQASPLPHNRRKAS